MRTMQDKSAHLDYIERALEAGNELRADLVRLVEELESETKAALAKGSDLLAADDFLGARTQIATGETLLDIRRRILALVAVSFIPPART